MDQAMPVQLSLGVSLRDDARFANFFINQANHQVLDNLKKMAVGQGPCCQLIWGSRGSGLTHLLQAVCHEAYAINKSVQYLPLQELAGYSPDDICDGLEDVALICLDGLDQICGHRDWESAIFHLFNNVKDAGHSLLFASHVAAPALPILLPDLKSRILGADTYRIRSLSDLDKQDVLIMRAQTRGMQMPVDVAAYILKRAPRDTNALFYLLNRLDDASLQHQRKLTIPFVKEVLCL